MWVEADALVRVRQRVAPVLSHEQGELGAAGSEESYAAQPRSACPVGATRGALTASA
jgi:hypothetical protein